MYIKSGNYSDSAFNYTRRRPWCAAEDDKMIKRTATVTPAFPALSSDQMRLDFANQGDRINKAKPVSRKPIHCVVHTFSANKHCRIKQVSFGVLFESRNQVARAVVRERRVIFPLKPRLPRCEAFAQKNPDIEENIEVTKSFGLGRKRIDSAVRSVFDLTALVGGSKWLA